MNLPLQQRASATDANFACHGRILAVPRCPKRESDEGDQGSAIHHAIATRLIAELGALPPPDGLPSCSVKVNAFNRWIVDWAVRFVKETVPANWSLLVEWEFSERYELPRPVWVPVSEIIGPITDGFVVRDNRVLIDHFIQTGHADITALSPDGTQSIGIDWKSGSVGADPAENNWQAGTYLGLAKRSWDTIQSGRFILAQPLIDEDSSGIPRVSEVTLTGAQLDAMNAEIAEQTNRALEDRYTTDSGPKQCRYCNVGLRCPSIQAEKEFMKATLNPERLEALAKEPDDALIGDFVAASKVLEPQFKDVKELAKERIRRAGYIDAGCGVRYVLKTKKGHISIPDKTKYREAVEVVLPERERQDRCIDWSKQRLIEEVADARGIGLTSKAGMSATAIYDAHLAPLTEQGISEMIVEVKA